MPNLEKLKYPIGKFVKPEKFDLNLVVDYIDTLDKLPPYFAQCALELSIEQLHTAYRPEGWNALQIVHHVADSHMNSFIRFKLALTETEPVIKTYKENLWANLPDAKDAGIAYSLQIISGVHYRWVHLLKTLTEQDFAKSIYHPEYDEKQDLFFLLSYYAWHTKHHLGHLKLINNNA